MRKDFHSLEQHKCFIQFPTLKKAKWFIVGDCKSCFGSLSERLMVILFHLFQSFFHHSLI